MDNICQNSNGDKKGLEMSKNFFDFSFRKLRAPIALLILLMLFIGNLSSFVDFAKASVVFSDGFESGGYGAWTGTYSSDATFGASTSYGHTGSYSSKVVINSIFSAADHGAYSYKTFPSTTKLYSRQYVYFTSFGNLASGHRGDIGMFLSENLGLDYVWVSFYNKAGTFVWALNDGAIVSNQSIPLNAWICVEVMYDCSVNKASLWINGNSIINNWASGISGTTIDTWRSGEQYTDINENGAAYYLDDVAVATSYNGPISGVGSPVVSNVSAGPVLAGGSCVFSSFWSDNVSLGGFVFSTNNTGVWQNDSWVSFGGTPSWANVSKVLSSVVGGVVGYRWFVNDSSGVWVDSGVKTLTVQSVGVGSPVVSNVSAGPVLAGGSCVFSSFWSDNVSLGGFVFSTNNTGVWQNDSWVSFGGTPSWANVSKVLSSVVGGVVGYRWFVNDSSGVWAKTGIQTFISSAIRKGAISITFDDGLQNQYTYAYPVLQAHGMVGTFYVITSFLSDFSNNSNYMNLAELHTIQNSGNEIGSHTVDHKLLTTLTDNQINYECNVSQQTLRSNGFTANNFAYPEGATNTHIDSIISQYYRSARQAYPVYGSSYIMIFPITTFSLPEYTVGQNGYNSDLANLKSIIDQISATNSYAIIVLHSVFPNTTTSSIMSVQDFSSFLDYVALKGVVTLTIDQALNETTSTLPASRLVFSVGANQSLVAGQVSSVVTVQRQDQYGNPVTSGDLSVSFGSNSAGGVFYSDVGSTVVSSVKIVSGSSSVSFWYSDAVVGSSVLTVSSLGLVSANTTFAVNFSVGVGSPVVSNVSAGPVLAGGSCVFSSFWSDNVSLGGFVFSTNNSGVWQNDSWVSFSGTPSWANVSKVLSSVVGAVVGYRWFVNDSSGVWGG